MVPSSVFVLVIVIVLAVGGATSCSKRSSPQAASSNVTEPQKTGGSVAQEPPKTESSPYGGSWINTQPGPSSLIGKMVITPGPTSFGHPTMVIKATDCADAVTGGCMLSQEAELKSGQLMAVWQTYTPAVKMDLGPLTLDSSDHLHLRVVNNSGGQRQQLADEVFNRVH